MGGEAEKMKTSVNTYSFSRVQGKDGQRISLTEMVATAKDIGFDAIEFSGGLEVPGWFKGGREEFGRYMAGVCRENGLEVAAYLVGADLLSPGIVDKLKREAETAASLGAKTMRHDIAGNAPEGRTYYDLIPFFAEKINEVTEYAKTLGVRTCTENHGYFSQDSDRVVSLCKAVGNSNFGLLVDFGNFMCADQISVNAVREAAPYAVHVHAKDFKYVSKEESETAPPGYFNTRGGNHLMGCALGEGVVDVAACIEIMKDAGYDGYMTVEFEGPFGDPLSEIGKGLSFLKKCI